MLRLTVHAFTRTPEAAVLIEQALTDRRLARLELKTAPGSLDEARAVYAAAPSPSLLVIETEGDVLAGVDALAAVCEPGTNLILLGAVNDVETYRLLTRRGVADYLVLPSPPARLVEAILELYTDPAKAPKGQAVAFIGAKGGTGSSVLAHNVAFALAQLPEAEVVVADLDLPFGSADLTFNVETASGIRNLLADPDRIDEGFLQRFAARHGDRLHLLAAPALLDADVGVDIRALEATIDALRHHVRHVVLDLPHLWSEWVRQTLRQADQVVITTTADLAGLRNARNLMDFVAQARPLDAPPILVLNRVGAQKKGEVSAKDFAETVGTPPTIVVPEDADAFGLAASHGKMLAEVKPKAKATEAVERLAGRLAAGKVPATKASGADALHALLGPLLGRWLKRPEKI